MNQTIFWILVWWMVWFWIFLGWYQAQVEKEQQPKKVTKLEAFIMFLLSGLAPIFALAMLLDKMIKAANPGDNDK